MFSELPKLFGKAFAIGFFLPAALLLLGLGVVLQGFGIITDTADAFADSLLGIAVSIFAIWLAAILMMALNRSLVRVLEGYGDRNPLRARKGAMRRHFAEKIQPLVDEARRIDEARADQKPGPRPSDGFAGRLSEAVATFPDESLWVLATRFGNIVRAFEVYPRVVYGLDAIPAWPRLMMVLPEQARTQIQESRAVLDFAINLVSASLIIFVIYGGLAIAMLSLPRPWVALMVLGFLCIGRFLMHQAARQWGEQVKSAFDLYRANLAEQLGLELPCTSALERQMWRSVSRTMIFRSASAAEDLDRFRKCDRAPPKEGNTPADRHERIRQRAYELWEQEGRPEGRALHYWQRAETEIAGVHASTAAPSSRSLAFPHRPAQPGSAL